MITIRDFFTSWCVPCQQLAPILEKIVAENEDVQLVKVDCSFNIDLAVQNNVRSVPVLIIESDNGENVRLNGMQTEENILKEINRLRE